VSRDDELLRVLTTGEGRVMMVLLNALEFSDMDKYPILAPPIILL
jgi:hypothetical protein